MASILGYPKVQFFDTNTQRFLVGGKVYTYAAGTDDNIATYPTIADAQALTNANTNPIILDQRGEANIVLSGATKIKLTDANDVLIWTVDNIVITNTDIMDANNKYLIKFNSVANAANYVTVTNAIAGQNPIISVAGPDTNISLKLTGKGTGGVELGSNLTLTGTAQITLPTAVPGGAGGTGLNILPAGMVMHYAAPAGNVPPGWLICDGSNKSRTDYASLFSAIGTTYGSGDGATTFGLPQQARRVIMGANGAVPAGSGVAANTVGTTGGAETVTLGAVNLPAGAPYTLATFTSTGATTGASFNVPTSSGTWFSNGSAQAFSVTQPSIVMQMVIKY